MTGNVAVTPAEAVRLAEIAALVAKYKMALNNKKRRTLLAMNEKAFHSFELGLIVSRCCRDMDLDGAFGAYQDASKVGVAPGAETFCNLLSLTAGLGVQGSGQALVRTQEPPHNLSAALVVYEDMLRCGVEVPEASYTALIRCSCISNEVGRGLMFFKELQRLNITPKLRSFTSLLEALGTYTAPTNPASPTIEDPVECGFDIFAQMQERYALEPTEKEFVCMLRLCVATRDARFYSILETFADTGIVPASPELHAVLKEWFAREREYTITTSGAQRTGLLGANNETLRSLEVDERYRAEFLAQLQTFALVVDDNRKIKVNNKIKEQQKINAMKQQLKQLAQDDSHTSASDANTDTPPNTTTNDIATDTTTNTTDSTAPVSTQTPEAAAAREAQWVDFVKYLRFHSEHSQQCADKSDTEVSSKRARTTTTDTPSSTSAPTESTTSAEPTTTTSTTTTGPSGFNIIVDGANVGYFKQNYAGAPQHVDYHQIDRLLQHLRSVGFTPLLILHCRHTSKYMIPNEEVNEMVKRWRAENCIYATPKGFNDDWFWLYGAVAHRCKVVTNDEMRDHHFQLLSPKWFNRWRERSRVQFTFGVWQDQQLAQQRRSVISGSSNSASNSATLRALQCMPVSLTSDYAPRRKGVNPHGIAGAEAGEGASADNGASSAESDRQSDNGHASEDMVSGENEGEEEGEEDGEGEEEAEEHDGEVSSDDEDDEQPVYRAKAKPERAPRRVSLRWPSPYSYCLQHIVGSVYEGYYCPPLPLSEEELAQKTVYDAGVFGVTSDKVKSEWLCIYKPILVNTDCIGENNGSVKRKSVD